MSPPAPLLEVVCNGVAEFWPVSSMSDTGEDEIEFLANLGDELNAKLGMAMQKASNSFQSSLRAVEFPQGLKRRFEQSVCEPCPGPLKLQRTSCDFLVADLSVEGTAATCVEYIDVDHLLKDMGADEGAQSESAVEEIMVDSSDEDRASIRRPPAQRKSTLRACHYGLSGPTFRAMIRLGLPYLFFNVLHWLFMHPGVSNERGLHFA